MIHHSSHTVFWVFSWIVSCICPLAALEPAQLRNAIEYLESDQTAHREATYRACRQRGDEFKETYRKMLDRARSTHARKFMAAVNQPLAPKSDGAKFLEAWRAWESSSEAARSHVQANHEKQKPALDEMDRLYAAAAGDWKALNNPRGKKTAGGKDPVATVISNAAAALIEISREIAWLRNPDDTFSEPGIKDLEEEFALNDAASVYLKARNGYSTAITELLSAHDWNDRQSWANQSQKEFARILNERRIVLGLNPLKLNENLSTACRKHSEEMERLKYFSHESPVEENRTFGMRASNAGFQGASGECIFAGSTSAAAAERAWWYSCGHRLINYSSGPNTLGIGISNVHWTLNTGNISE